MRRRPPWRTTMTKPAMDNGAAAPYDVEIALRSVVVKAVAAYLLARLGAIAADPEVALAIGAVVGYAYDRLAYSLKSRVWRRRRRPSAAAAVAAFALMPALSSAQAPEIAIDLKYDLRSGSAAVVGAYPFATLRNVLGTGRDLEMFGLSGYRPGSGGLIAAGGVRTRLSVADNLSVWFGPMVVAERGRRPEWSLGVGVHLVP